MAEEKKTRTGLYVVVAIAATILLCCLCLVTCFGLLMVIGVNELDRAREDSVTALCPADGDVADAYTNNTTATFKANFTLEEYRNEIRPLQGDFCSELESGAWNTLTKGGLQDVDSSAEADSDQVVTAEFSYEGQLIDVEFVSEGSTETYKLNDLDVR